MPESMTRGEKFEFMDVPKAYQFPVAIEKPKAYVQEHHAAGFNFKWAYDCNVYINGPFCMRSYIKDYTVIYYRIKADDGIRYNDYGQQKTNYIAKNGILYLPNRVCDTRARSIRRLEGKPVLIQRDEVRRFLGGVIQKSGTNSLNNGRMYLP